MAADFQKSWSLKNPDEEFRLEEHFDEIQKDFLKCREEIDQEVGFTKALNEINTEIKIHDLCLSYL